MEMNNKKIDVAYCCNEYLVEVLAVSIVSLLENNKHALEINIYVINENISFNNVQKLENLVNDYNRNIYFIDLPKLDEKYNNEKLNISVLGHSYGKLLVGSLIGESIKKVLMLDVDTIVLGDLSQLFKIDIEGYIMAAVDDCMGKKTIDKMLNMPLNSRHVNSGMMLINVEEWRKNKIDEVYINYLIEYLSSKKALSFFEEEVINNTIGDKIKIIHPKFDLMSLDIIFNYEETLKFRGPELYYSKEKIDEAKKDPVIFHGTSFCFVQKKYYEYGSKHPYSIIYDKYRDLTEWKNQPKIKSKGKKIKKILVYILCLMPKVITIPIARFIRDNIRPIIYRNGRKCK